MLTKLTHCGMMSVCCVALLLTTALGSAVRADALVSDQEAARLGLERAWFAQVRVDPARHKVVHWVTAGDRLFALTSAGALQAIDAETGATLWTTEIGVEYVPAAGLAVNSKYVAVLGAGRLYLLDRADGHHHWSRQVGGASSAAPALSEEHAYVALVSGRVEGYRLDDSKAPVWQYVSIGRTFQSPTTTGEVVSWPTDQGLLYVGRADPPRVLFRVETNDEIVAAPAEQAPYLYAASLDGYLYCYDELTGGEQWRYSTGYAVTSQPAIVGNQAFVASVGPTLHAVDSLTGESLWRLPGLSQFVALGKQHVYGMDQYGTLVAVDGKSGSVAGRISTDAENRALVNDKSDRLFLINDRGLVQCLHEIGAKEPTWHRGQTTLEADGESKQDRQEPKDPAAAESEFGGFSDSPFEEEGGRESTEEDFEAEEESSEFGEENPFGF